MDREATRLTRLLIAHHASLPMICRSCGTDIADKALICYRCGTAVAPPTVVRPPAARRRSQNSLLVSLALVVLVMAALFMGRTMQGEVPQTLSRVLLGLALIVAVGRLLTRRFRRR